MIDLLPDREMATVAAWFRDHRDVEIVSRDRGGGYGDVARREVPHALQVADRWHLFENAGAAFVDAVRRHMREIRQALSTGAVDPALLASAEKLQWEGWRQRHKINEHVVALHRDGATIKRIARGAGIARQTVRRILRGARDDVFRVSASSLEALTERLE
jgi:transposase